MARENSTGLPFILIIRLLYFSKFIEKQKYELVIKSGCDRDEKLDADAKRDKKKRSGKSSGIEIEILASR